MDPSLAPGICHPQPDLPSRTALKLRDRIVDYPLAEMAVLLRTGELSAEQLAIACLARLYEFEDTHGFSLHIDVQQALTRARLADQWLSNADDPRGPPPLLCGLVLGLDSTATVPRLDEQGAILIGPLRAPLYPDDGETGLSAVSPIARLCAAALAEPADDGFLLPAARHAASAIKPSLGLAMGWGVPGSVARSVRDASLLLAAIDGCGTFAPLQWPVAARPGVTPLAGVCMGVAAVPDGLDDSPDVAVFERFRRQLGKLGADIIELPGIATQPQDGWEQTLRQHHLDLLLMLCRDTRPRDWQPRAPGWPMVTLPIDPPDDEGIGVNALLCGPHLSDALLVQVALDFQDRYPHYHDRPATSHLRPPTAQRVTAPRKAWPTG